MLECSNRNQTVETVKKKSPWG